MGGTKYVVSLFVSRVFNYTSLRIQTGINRVDVL